MTTISDSPLYPNDNSEYSTGDIVYINNRSTTLRDTIGHGGQGVVFEIEGNTNIVAKLYHRYVINRRQIEQLKLIVSANLRTDSLAAPINLIFDSSNKEIIGYTMDRVSGVNLGNTLIIDGDNYNKREIVQLVYNIVRAYHKLDSTSSHKILAGDINPNNVMVYDKTKVKLIDLDSIQIDDFPCPVGFAGFNHPTAVGKNYRTFLRTEYNEQFAIAVLIFFILINKHPFAQKNGQDDDSNVKNLPFRYKLDESQIQNIPIEYVYRWSTLTPELQQLFIDVFTTAKDSRPKLVTFEQWEKELEDYSKTLAEVVLENRLFDIWRLTMDPFSEAKVCPYCGNAFTPDSNNELCPRCSKLNLVKLHCANSYCATPDKVYYIPTSKVHYSSKYCSDCLQPYITSCKRCGLSISVRKYEIHTFDGRYCDIHRPPAKGRLTKAKNTISTQIDILTEMFKSGNYSLYRVEDALKDLKRILANIQKDDDIDEVIPVIDSVNSLIGEMELFKYDYRTWFNTLKNTRIPVSSTEKEHEIKKLRENLSLFDTLSRKWKNKDITFKRGLGYKHLVNFYNTKINEIEKVHFKKCSCCGKEERNDGWTYATEYYCPDCLKEYKYTCRHCNATYMKPRYLHDKETLGTLCDSCTNEVNRISDIISKTTAKNFEKMESFESLNFASRKNHFSKIFGSVSAQVENYKKINFGFLRFDKLKEQAFLVANEESLLQKHQIFLRDLNTRDLNGLNYPELLKLQRDLTQKKIMLSSKSRISKDWPFCISDLAPVPLALKSINSKEQCIQDLIDKKKNFLKNTLLSFDVLKSSLSRFDGYSVDWGKRASDIGKVNKVYLPIFEEYSADIPEAKHEMDFITKTFPLMIENEERFFKGPLQILSYYDSYSYTVSEADTIDRAIHEVVNKKNFLKEKGKRFILNNCIIEKADKLIEKLEEMKSILNGTFFNQAEEYAKRPIVNWSENEIIVRTTGHILNADIPRCFSSVVREYSEKMLSVIKEHDDIVDSIRVYVENISKSFKLNYKENFLCKEIPERIQHLNIEGYSTSDLDTLLQNARTQENFRKKKYTDVLKQKAESWKDKLSNYVILFFLNIYLIIQSAIDYYLTDTRTYESFLVFAIIGIVLLGYSAYSFMKFYKKKNFDNNTINFTINCMISIIIFIILNFLEQDFSSGMLKTLIVGTLVGIVWWLSPQLLISRARFTLDACDAAITEEDAL